MTTRLQSLEERHKKLHDICTKWLLKPIGTPMREEMIELSKIGLNALEDSIRQEKRMRSN